MSAVSFLEVKNLTKYFGGGGIIKKRPLVRAVDGISFSINRGETFGLVGESGCGKSTAARTIIRLYTPTAGSILFDGVEIAHLKEKALRPYRRRIQMIFQDPYASLDPRMTVARIVSEPLTATTSLPRSEVEARVAHSLKMV
ncbi:MAG: ATP-binding cassette domain-containing protein, partial [Caldilinea sp.]